MRSLTPRRAAVAAVVPLALSVLAACGTGSPTTAGDPLAGAPSSASSATASTNGHARTHPQNVEPAVFVGRVKAAAHALTTARFAMTLEIHGASAYAKGALDLTGDQPAMDISMDLTGMGTVTDLRIVGGAMYVEDPTSGPGKYLKVDLDAPGGPAGGLGDALDSFDPNQMLAKLPADTFKKVTDLGRVSIGGRQVEHYRVLLDTGAASKVFGSLPKTGALPRTVDYDLWLDSKDRIAKFTIVMKKLTSITTTYSDYGAPVHVTAPRASQITTTPGAGWS